MPWRNCCKMTAEVAHANGTLDPRTLIALVAAGVMPFSAGVTAVVKRSKRNVRDEV